MYNSSSGIESPNKNLLFNLCKKDHHILEKTGCDGNSSIVDSSNRTKTWIFVLIKKKQV